MFNPDNRTVIMFGNEESIFFNHTGVLKLILVCVLMLCGYLAVVIDLFSRRVIGWAVSNRIKKDLAIRALDMAVRLRNPPSGCIFHSDRGSQYCSHDFQKKLTEYRMTPSMSGKENCYDNAVVETFFMSLKAEILWRQSWPTRRQATTAIFQYINGFYNSRRRHSYLGNISQLAFEAKAA